MMKTLALVAVAAMGITACQNDFEEQVQVKDSVVVNFVADSAESRTSVDTSGATPVFSWNAEESFAVLEQTTSLAEATAVEYAKVDGKANIKATFMANPDKSDYKYVTIYPASGYAGGAESIESVTLNLPLVQTMAEGSYDPAADLMVSEVVTTSAQPTEADEAQMVRFTRLAAVVKMSLKNFGVALDDKVQSVTFEANGKALAGDVTVDFADLFEEDGITHKLTAAAEMSNSVTVNTTSAGDIYFTTLPTTLVEGDAYTITIVTDKYLYVKKGTIPAEKTLTFAAGMVTRFGVDMNSVAPSNKWKLVKDASTLKSGDVVTFATAQQSYNNHYALGAKYNGTMYPYAATTPVVKLGDYLYHPISEDLADRIQQVTLSKRYDDKVAFDLYNAAGEFTGDDKSGFYSSTSSNQYFKLQDYPNNNTLFYITIENGVASVVAEDADSEVKYLQFKPGSNATSSHYFQLRKNGDDYVYPVCIYKLEGAVGAIPVVKADVTVPIPTSSDAKEVVIAEEGVTAGDISAVTFNYVGDWTISVSDVVKGETGDATWLNVNYDKANNCLTYTAEPNSGAVRYATVTITATLDGEEPLTWSFGMLQKGAPVEISIAEFMQKGKDLDVSYKLTGILQEVPASGSASTTYKLADKNGNVAQITYLQTDAGVQVPGNDDIVFKKGDVVTVTTVVTSTTKGKGGSSAYPSYYKGYYRLNATATPSIVDYVGGDATITVTTEGNLLPADGVIEGAMAEAYDFVTLNHTDGDATATATFATNSGGSRSAEFNFTYGMASASVSVGQKNDPSVKVGWFLVTDASELKVGDKVIIAAKNPDGTLDYAFIKQTSSSTASTKGVAIELQGNEIANVEGVEQFTLESGHTDYAGTWAFKGNSYNKYLYNSSGTLKFTTTLSNTGSWNVTIDSDGKATLEAEITNSKKILMFTYTDYNQTFSGQASGTTGKGAIYLYKYYN